MDVIALTPFAAPVNKPSLLKVRDEFPYFRRHAITLDLLRDAKNSLCCSIPLSTLHTEISKRAAAFQNGELDNLLEKRFLLR